MQSTLGIKDLKIGQYISNELYVVQCNNKLTSCRELTPKVKVYFFILISNEGQVKGYDVHVDIIWQRILLLNGHDTVFENAQRVLPQFIQYPFLIISIFKALYWLCLSYFLLQNYSSFLPINLNAQTKENQLPRTSSFQGLPQRYSLWVNIPPQCYTNASYIGISAILIQQINQINEQFSQMKIESG